MKKWTDKIMTWAATGIVWVLGAVWVGGLIGGIYMTVNNIASDFRLFLSAIGVLTIIVGIPVGIHKLLWNWGLKRKDISWLMSLESKEMRFWFYLVVTTSLAVGTYFFIASLFRRYD